MSVISEGSMFQCTQLRSTCVRVQALPLRQCHHTFWRRPRPAPSTHTTHHLQPTRQTVSVSDPAPLLGCARAAGGAEEALEAFEACSVHRTVSTVSTVCLV